jgi:hypothetical protein
MPDLRLPAPLMHQLGLLRSHLGRLARGDGRRPGGPRWAQRLVGAMVGDRMSRFSYTGDYAYGRRQGWLHVLADTSAVYARRRARMGLPTMYVPWGAASNWHADLGLERDIDVLWLGRRGTQRRSRLLDRVRADLRQRGVEIHVVDNVENPFVYNAARTHLINRAKVTLNLTRTWYDDNFSRFALAAPNRSLVVSEPVLPHCPEFRAGAHYVSAPVDQLADCIVHYLRHDDERQCLVERAYQLVTTGLRFGPSLRRLLETALNA